ncbi:hypothetical protein ACVWYH_001201 [Bradyrhizobium sp. GM24.11]
MGPGSAAHHAAKKRRAALRPGHETLHNFNHFLNPPVTNLGDQWTDLCPKAAAHALP